MKNDQINKKVEATLSSLDNMNRAEAPPYFYSHLEAKMQAYKPSVFEAFLQLLNRPAIAVSILSVFLVLNIMAIKGLSTDNTSSVQKTASLQNFAAQYNLSTTTVYTNSGR